MKKKNYNIFHINYQIVFNVVFDVVSKQISFTRQFGLIGLDSESRLPISEFSGYHCTWLAQTVKEKKYCGSKFYLICFLDTNERDVETREVIVGIATDIDLIHYISKSEQMRSSTSSSVSSKRVSESDQ